MGDDERLTTMTYEVRGPVAHVVLNRPHRGNGITFRMPRCVGRTGPYGAVSLLTVEGW
jgi:enoyl-CoA hydratase/carnithine racemase